MGLISIQEAEHESILQGKSLCDLVFGSRSQLGYISYLIYKRILKFQSNGVED